MIDFILLLAGIIGGALLGVGLGWLSGKIDSKRAHQDGTAAH